MPEVIHYTVEQTRSVDVFANNAEDAVRIAEMAFKHGQNSSAGVKMNHEVDVKLAGIYGNSSSQIKELSVSCKRKTP